MLQNRIIVEAGPKFNEIFRKFGLNSLMDKSSISTQFSFTFIYYGWSWKLFCLFDGHFISLSCLFMCFVLDLNLLGYHNGNSCCFTVTICPVDLLPKPLFLVFQLHFKWVSCYSTELSFYYAQIENLLIDKLGPFSFIIWLLCWLSILHISYNYWV